jgi:hypothetical protein
MRLTPLPIFALIGLDLIADKNQLMSTGPKHLLALRLQ